MRKISDRALFNHYIEKYGIDNIFDKEILNHAQLREYQKGELVLEAGSVLERKIHVSEIISCISNVGRCGILEGYTGALPYRGCERQQTSYEEIAQFLGTAYRHLNRTIKELESKSIIRCKDRKIYVLDIEKLQDLSKNIFIKP